MNKEHLKLQEERKDVTLRFRLTPAQDRYMSDSLKKLGVKDFSSFARGALLNAIEMGFRARDPKWREFVETVQGPAKEILGFGLALGSASDTEGVGSPRKGYTPSELRQRLAKRNAKAA